METIAPDLSDHTKFPLHSNPCNQVMRALLTAKPKFDSLVKTDSAQRSKYTPLDKVISCVEEPLLEHGVLITHSAVTMFEADFCICTLYHSSGQWLRSYLPLILAQDKNQPMQKLGSSYSYGRRYTLQAVLGLQPKKEDDDGQSSGHYSDRAERNAPQGGNSWRKDFKPPNNDHGLMKTHLQKFNITPQDVDHWAQSQNLKTKWQDWNPDSKRNFIAQLASGDVTAEMIKRGDPLPPPRK